MIMATLAVTLALTLALTLASQWPVVIQRHFVVRGSSASARICAPHLNQVAMPRQFQRHGIECCSRRQS